MNATLDDSLIVLDTLPEAYLRFDRDLRLTFANRAAEILFSVDRTELAGKRIGAVHGVAVLEECSLKALGQGSAVQCEYYFEPLERWYAIIATPDASGGVVVRICDDTARKHVEDALRE